MCRHLFSKTAKRAEELVYENHQNSPRVKKSEPDDKSDDKPDESKGDKDVISKSNKNDNKSALDEMVFADELEKEEPEVNADDEMELQQQEQQQDEEEEDENNPATDDGDEIDDVASEDVEEAAEEEASPEVNEDRWDQTSDDNEWDARFSKFTKLI